jgi:hypothetical protein
MSIPAGSPTSPRSLAMITAPFTAA